jgi:DNA primase
MDINYKDEIIKREIDGYAYISNYVNLKRTGSVYQALCPFHNEKTGSFTVYTNEYRNRNGKKQGYTSFYCFGCGKGGDVISFKQYQEGISREEARKEFERELGLINKDQQIQQNYLQKQLKYIKNSPNNTLSLSEINLICSSKMRNYLKWVNNKCPNQFNNEFNKVEKFYQYLDEMLLNLNSIEAMNLIKQTDQKIKKLKENI